MSLNRNEVNPLSVLQLRKLTYIPKHFSKILIEVNSDIIKIDKWISFNLNSRYAIKKNYILAHNKMTSILEVGIEDPKELTMLTLGCPYLHNKEKY